MRLSVVAIGVLASLCAAPSAVRRQTSSPPTPVQNLFWCPMHPDVRSKDPGRCPICSMTLVAIPSATIGNYRLHVRQMPRENGTGVRLLRIEVRDPVSAERVAGFSTLHERLLHLFVLGRDLAYFAHVHPEFVDGAFEVPVNLDPGAYVLLADFAPDGGPPQLVHVAVVTPDYRGPLFGLPRLTPDYSEKTVDGVRVSLEAEPRVLKPSVLRFKVSDAATGAPVQDLEPFLGASGHLLIVNADVTTAMHAHPESVDKEPRIRPEVVFTPTFGAAGVYKMWVQFQRGGKVITAPFAIAAK